MSDYYQEEVKKETDLQRGKIYYRTAKEIELPYDYFDEIKKGLSHELKMGYVDLKTCLEHHGKTEAALEALRKEIDVVDSRLNQLENVGSIEIREMTVEEAKPVVEKFLKEFLSTHERVYPSDVADGLCLRYELVRQMFDILQKEGKLE